MDNLLAARFQMGTSLGFHILFAVVGIGMPLLMLISEIMWLRTKEEVYLTLAKRWSKGTAIMFAVGAVSGTVLSFQLGLLWPQFMAYAGPIIGMPFSLEGLAFFLEAIFLGIYLYGWDKISPKAHCFSGFMVMLSGTFSGIFVVTANAWMNSPTGFEMLDGKPINIDPIAAMLNASAFTQTLHMTIAAFLTVGFAVAGVHAFMLLSQPNNIFHRRALTIGLVVGGVMALLQPISGDLSAKHVAKNQPIKFAAMEAHWETEKGASLHIGGWPDEEDEVTRYAIKIPYLLSILAHSSPSAEVKGLKEFPKEERPPVLIVHIAFQIMVGIGSLMILATFIGAYLYWKKRPWYQERWFLWLLVLIAPTGFIAVEAGWVVTEVGRQPWIIRGIMKTSEAVTPMPHLVVPFLVFSVLYIFLSIVVVILLRQHVIASPEIFEESTVKEDADVSCS